VIISTSASNLKGTATGLWLEELSAPYYAFKDAKFDVVIASPNGGAIPIDQGSVSDPFFTDDSKKFLHDGEAVGALSHSVKLDTINFNSDDYDAIYMPGGHGTCVDFINNPALKNAIETAYKAGKIVSSVCHGPMCFVDCVKENGDAFVKGETVTGFSNSEEEALQKSDIVPFLLETKFIEQGANYEKGDDWTSKVSVSNNIVTGQNPQSSLEVAEAVISLLSMVKSM